MVASSPIKAPTVKMEAFNIVPDYWRATRDFFGKLHGDSETVVS